MPSGFAALDTSFPDLNGKDEKEALQLVTDYLYQLLEQLRYMLHNLGTRNFNRADLEAFASSISTPINIALQEEIDRATGAEGTLQTSISIEAGRITAEVTRATEAEGALGTRITQTADAISAEVTRATAAEGTLSSRITQAADAITAEVTRATAAEGVLQSSITQTADAISAEVTRATGAEGSLSARITQNAGAITAEVTRATGAESALGSRITQTAEAIQATVAAAENKYEIPAGLTITMFGYGEPTADASEHSGAVYLDQETGYYYTSDGTAWTRSAAALTLISSALSSQITQTANAITAEVTRATGAESAIQLTADDIKAQVTDGNGNYTVLNMKSDGLHIGSAQGVTTIAGGSITANSITLTQLGSDVTGSFGDANPSYIKSTYIDSTVIKSPEIRAGQFYGQYFNVMPALDSYGQYVENSQGGFGIYGFFAGVLRQMLKIEYYDALSNPTVSFSSPAGAEFNFFDTLGIYGYSYINAPVYLNDEVIVNGCFGTLAQRDAIQRPVTGQLFFVI